LKRTSPESLKTLLNAKDSKDILASPFDTELPLKQLKPFYISDLTTQCSCYIQKVLCVSKNEEYDVDDMNKMHFLSLEQTVTEPAFRKYFVFFLGI
jgi:hypothetical protein